ncbi:UNVERIFIED_CONTAM: hypothetical protein FKN15_000223 [Acipenser sinensis]
MVAACVGAPRDPEMDDDLKALIEQINRNTAAQKEQTKKWRQELGLPDPEPTELELLLQKWEQAEEAWLSAAPAREAPESPAPEVLQGEQEEETVPEPPGERSPGVACTGGSARRTGGRDRPGTRGGEHHTSTTAPDHNPGRGSGAGQCGPLPLAPGHPAGLPRPPCAWPGAQESAPSATALPLVPYSALPKHPDVAGLLPDVAGAPPVRR